MNESNMIICRCEEVTLGELLQTLDRHQCSARELKLRTRAGMGCCGGRTCRSLIQAVMQNATGTIPADAVPLGYQPPVRPISFHLLGGKN
ncbi:(2Fe-2S)-binding protein [Brevibacillus sp. H7]|uniref:(2Fe-2S)-binding protein n=1 Tax=Brevibacillus sp. H7 TaxID=3349138 RepID=UPI00382A2105